MLSGSLGVGLGAGVGAAVCVGVGAGVSTVPDETGVAGGGSAGGGLESAGRSETMTQLCIAIEVSRADPNDKQLFMTSSPFQPGVSPVPPSPKPQCYHASLARVGVEKGAEVPWGERAGLAAVAARVLVRLSCSRVS